HPVVIFLDTLGLVTVNANLYPGTPPDQLLRIHGAVHHLPQLGRYFSEHGFVAGVEVIGLLPPKAQLTLVFPHAGATPNREALFAGFQLVAALNERAVTPGKYAGRDVFEMKLDNDVGLAYWQEGEHVVCTIGTQKPDWTL